MSVYNFLKRNGFKIENVNRVYIKTYDIQITSILNNHKIKFVLSNHAYDSGTLTFSSKEEFDEIYNKLLNANIPFLVDFANDKNGWYSLDVLHYYKDGELKFSVDSEKHIDLVITNEKLIETFKLLSLT